MKKFQAIATLAKELSTSGYPKIAENVIFQRFLLPKM